MTRIFTLALVVVLAGTVAAVYAAEKKSDAPKAAPSASATPTAAAGVATPAGYTGKPYNGEVNQIPGIIQAEHYDVAPDNKDGITFHYKGAAKKGDGRTTPDCIGTAKFGNGHVSTKGEKESPDQVYLGWTQDGEWMKYTVHVKEAGTYKVGGKFASASKNGKISFTFTDAIKTGPLSIPTTDGFQPGVEVYHVWLVSDSLGEVTLPAGDYVLTVTLEVSGGSNMDYFTFTKK
jgi:Carbohydrate binding module (family 6)